MPFPTTPTLDNCSRADEDPLSNGGTWTNPLWPTWANVKLVSNQITAVANFAGAYINNINPGPDCEAWAVIQGSVSDSHFLYWRILNPNNASISGYRLQIVKGADQLVVSRIDNSGSIAQLGATYSVTMNFGDVVGVRMIGPIITPYVAGVAQATRTDATYATAGRIGIGLASTSLTFSSFGGGTFIPTSGDFPGSHRIRSRATSW